MLESEEDRIGNPANLVEPVGGQENAFYECGAILEEATMLPLGPRAALTRIGNAKKVFRTYAEPGVEIMLQRGVGRAMPEAPTTLPMAQWASSQDEEELLEPSREPIAETRRRFYDRDELLSSAGPLEGQDLACAPPSEEELPTRPKGVTFPYYKSGDECVLDQLQMRPMHVSS